MFIVTGKGVSDLWGRYGKGRRNLRLTMVLSTMKWIEQID